MLEKHLEEIRDGRGTKPEQSVREFLEAVLYLIRTGEPWRDLPPQLGSWHSVYCRFRRWEKAGYWLQLWQELSRPEVQKVCALFLDSTTVRAHQHAAGAPKTARHRLWDARGGLTTKIHLAALSENVASAARLSPGCESDFEHFPAVDQQACQQVDPQAVVTDKGFDSNAIREQIQQDHRRVVIPSRSCRKVNLRHNKNSTAEATESSGSSTESKIFAALPLATRSWPRLSGLR